MTAIPPLRNAGLVLLQQTAAFHTQQLAENGPADAILAVLDKSLEGGSTGTTQAEAALSENIFSVNYKSPSELKLDLLERTGKEFGLDMDSFGSAQDYGSALRRIVSDIRARPDGETVLRAIEEKLGLDELGLNIDDIVAAASDPDGAAGDKVENALAEKYGYGPDDKTADEKNQPLGVVTDETGLYAIATG